MLTVLSTENTGFFALHGATKHTCAGRAIVAHPATRALRPRDGVHSVPMAALSRYPSCDALIDETVENPAVVLGQQHAAPQREVDAAVVVRSGGGEAIAARTTDHGPL